MIKQTVTYMDFNDQMVTEDLYFHLSAKELTDVPVEGEGDLRTRLMKVQDSNDISMVMRTFHGIILEAYGTRSEDGRGFVKTVEQREKFACSLAFDALFAELMTHPDTIAGFVTGIIPKVLMDAVAEVEGQPAKSKEDEVPWAHRRPTKSELQKMSKAQMIDVMQGKTGVPPDEEEDVPA
jgi:hypothetical protein